MDINALPLYDSIDKPTGCCPRFAPESWDDQDLHFKDMLFVKAKTKSFLHIPLNMGSVYKKTFDAIQAAHALDDKHFIILSRDLSSWSAEHLFSVDAPVEGAEMVRLNGDYRTKVFEGPYRNVPIWCGQMEKALEARGERAELIYYFYTTCPKCAKAYGKNYVVAVAKLAS